jgi:RNA polymerase sigma-70 factor (ECF subfamily)
MERKGAVTSVLPPFYKVLEDHGDEVLAYVRKLAPADHEDVFQEAVLRALRSYPRLSHGDHLRAWLYRVATTTVFDQTAKKRREIPVASVPDNHHVDRMVDEEFDALVGRLPDGAKRALQLRFVNDLSYDQIAARLGCSSAAARQRVSSAVRRLREEL